LAKVPSGFPKQAIVVIHGMGEQKPMDTIKAFAHAVWTSDPAVHLNNLRDSGHIWSKPDDRTGSLELRRLTTRESTPTETYTTGARQDFYELYWSDLSNGTTWNRFKSWVLMLLWRNPFVPELRRVWLAWFLLVIVVLAILVLVGLAALPAPLSDFERPSEFYPQFWNWPVLHWLAPFRPSWIGPAAIAVLGWLAHAWVVPYFGDVARYTRAIPDNIAARKAIRERGLELLEELHREEYDRIIVVGHSLGSILAYDLVSYYWAMHPESYTIRTQDKKEFALLCKLEDLVGALGRCGDSDRRPLVEEFRSTQRQFCRLLRTRPKPAGQDKVDRRWLITDLITVGSPLGHADFLLAKNPADRRARIEARELATCPPIREPLDPEVKVRARADGLNYADKDAALFCFPTKNDGEWQLHHAAQFAVVRWTNIHDPAFLVAFGDIISAPAAPVFGDGVIDIDLRRKRGQSWRFTHTRYWAENKPGAPPPLHLVKLREALDLAAQEPL
jgi:hypothetical protein